MTEQESISYYCGLLQLICEELNVKQFRYEICATEKGIVEIAYTVKDDLDKTEQKLEVFVGGKLTETSDKFKEQMLEAFFKCNRK